MSDVSEKVYFDNSAYLVTSKRVLLKRSGETLVVNEIQDPKIDFHLGPVLADPIALVWNLLPFGENFEKGRYEVVCRYRGRHRIIATQHFFKGPDWFTKNYPSCMVKRWNNEEFDAEHEETKKLATAIGEAVAGV